MTPAKGYTEMKDSGIEWVGMIPAHWHIKVLFQLVSQVKNKNKDLSETNLLSLSYGKIKRKNIDDTEGLLPASFDSYNIIENNDIVLRLTDLQNDHTSLRVGRATERGIITSAYITIRPTNSRMSEYLYYLLHSFDIKKGFYGMGSGVRQGLNYDEVKMLKLPLPPLNEESAIAAYLDTQCAKIDEIIAQAKASIEDYKQWKASIIYEAVTKGLNPNVEMKDSGIEWIGRMPAHWTAPALKHLCTMQAGKNLISEQISTSGQYPVYGGNGQRGYYSDYNANGNFLLVGRQGALCGNVHYVSGKFWATEHAVVTTPSKITNIRYLYYLLIAMDLNQYASNSAAQPGLSVGNILTVKTLLPPIGEQVRISEFLDNGCPKIDEVITEKQSLIDDLESYKKSLIYEVVTGKRRVV